MTQPVQPRSIGFLVLAAWLCGCPAAEEKQAAAPAPAAPAGPLSAADYDRLVDEVMARLERDFAAFEQREFASQAEAMDAMFDLGPAGSTAAKHIEDVIAEQGVDRERLVEFLAANGDLAKAKGKQLQARLTRSRTTTTAHKAALQNLPPGNLQAALARASARNAELRENKALQLLLFGGGEP